MSLFSHVETHVSNFKTACQKFCPFALKVQPLSLKVTLRMHKVPGTVSVCQVHVSSFPLRLYFYVPTINSTCRSWWNTHTHTHTHTHTQISTLQQNTWRYIPRKLISRPTRERSLCAFDQCTESLSNSQHTHARIHSLWAVATVYCAHSVCISPRLQQNTHHALREIST